MILRDWKVNTVFKETHSENNILCLMKHFFFCAIVAHSHGKMNLLHPKAKEASSWTIILLWIWFGVIWVLRCPSGLSSTLISLHTHYMQALGYTWVPCNVQMVNFHLSRQFCHSHMEFRSGLLSKWKSSIEESTELIFILKCTAPVTSALPCKGSNYNFKSTASPSHRR